MAISTETIRKITIQGSAVGVDETTRSVQGLSAAVSNSATVTDVATRRQLSAADAYKRQTLAIDDQARMHDLLARKVAVATAAFNQGVLGDVNSASAKAALAQRVADLNKKYGDSVDVFGQMKIGVLSVLGLEGLMERMFIRMAVLMAAREIIGFAAVAFQNAAAIKEQAAQAGVGIEAFQAYSAVMEQSGLTADESASLIARLTKNIGEAKDKSGAARDAMNQLGVSYADLAGGAADAMPKVAAGLLAIGDTTQRARLETVLFGKAGQELDMALSQLINPTATLVEKQKALGLVLGTDVVNGAEKARAAMTESFRRLQNDVTPIITGLAIGLAKVIELFTPRDKTADFSGVQQHLVQVPTTTSKYFPQASPQTGNTGMPTEAMDKYIAQQKISADLAGLSAQRRAEEEATIAAANAKLEDGAYILTNQDKTLRKNVASYSEALQVVGPTVAKQVEGAAALISQGRAADKLKESFVQYLAGLNEQTRLAGESVAQREIEAAVIKGAQVYQTQNNVLAKDLVKDYQGAVDILKAHGNLLPVINALEQKRDNELKLQNNAANDNLDILNLQISLVGKSNLQQAEAVALLRAQQALKQTYGAGFDPANPTDEQQRALDLAVKQADATVALTVANESYNSSLSATADLLAEMAGNAQDAAKGMADGFGKVGKAIGDVVAAQAVYNARQADFAVQREQINKSGVDVANRLALVTQKQANVEDQYYADSIDGLKNMFGQKTAAYKVLSAVEGTYNALRLAGNIEAMISDAAATALKVATVPVHVAANETIAASGVAAGAGQIFAELGPWGFPVVAAMMAVMLGLGFSGGGGGSSAPAIDIAKQRQGQQGAGTVLGDSTAKSDSIAKSLEELAKDTNTDLEYSNQMVTSLKAIENSIGSLTSLLARQLSVGGLFDTGGLNLGTNGGSSGGIIGALLGSIFGSSKTTNTLLDQGIQIAATTIGQAVAGGLQANAYQTVQSTKTSSALFGLISSSKTTTGTTATPLSSDFTGGIESIIGSLRATVLDAATKLGVEGAQDVVDSFALNLGSISFKDMTGSQIQDTLTQVFGALGDNIAAAAVPQIVTLQQVGEGALQTLARLVQEYTVVDDAAKVVGFSFSQVGVDSLSARDNLVQLSGGLDQFSSQANFFSDNFLSKAQALAPIQQAVTVEMARLGQAGITTKEQFAAVVQGIDASTASGAQLYAALMNVAPAFVKVADAAADLADQRTKMQITLLNATGDALGALNLQRAQELAALDASLLPLQNQIYAAQDAATAAAALKAANDDAAAGAQKQAQAEAQQAQAAEALARTRAGLEITLMQDTGNAAGALALKRQQELDAIDASLVPLQNQIYAAEDLNTATQAAAAALTTSLNILGTSISDLTSNAGKAAQAAQTTADSWGNAFSSITQAQTALLISGPGLSPQDKYNASRNQFDTLRTRALAGDASAASDEASFASQFLQTSFGFNGATAAYGSDLSYVQDTLSSLAQYTKVQQDSAQATADALTAMASKLGEIADGIRAGNVTNEIGFDELSGQVKDLADEIAQENLQARHA